MQSAATSILLLNILINAMLWGYLIFGLYNLYQKKILLAFWGFLASGGMSVPYLFFNANNINAAFDLDKTRLFIETLLFTCLFLQTANYTYNMVYLKKPVFWTSWPTHLLISFFIVVISFATLIAFFDGNALSAKTQHYFILPAFFIFLLASSVWSLQQIIRVREFNEHHLTDFQDAVMDSISDILGGSAAVLFLVYYSGFVVSFIVK
ncbi:MAG: hypothetical protein A3H02_01115 [Candidatus Niyogibacteria bacterium RIFCSPLOWO2_12_FULL_41_13]|uniref:Uncharacterized protein n=1 Tax=Candidatus Niyogibacteria bacterium RIFCSPLOWO2_12_FULL_41_13 TaxID=1801726 RepID=A0A1G2F3P8_9BACT|nr:MAG: hypothetical protein A3H02_01115 [Candidatus Niyogibacteria bacterium RIFCSPLOWO2_12_FULL_41_13]